MRILALDQAGQPNRWISAEDSVIYHAKQLVAWQLGEGEDDIIFRGGENRITGRMSRIVTAPIIAVKGEGGAGRRPGKTLALTNRELFRRDRYLCAYCGRVFPEMRLTRDHVVPTSRGGRDVWTNAVACCADCNNRKDDRLPEECGMQLLYVPYAPNRAEALILENKCVLGCQMAYLQSFLPAHSRVWDNPRERAH